jgi:hypothetical protein
MEMGISSPVDGVCFYPGDFDCLFQKEKVALESAAGVRLHGLHSVRSWACTTHCLRLQVEGIFDAASYTS